MCFKDIIEILQEDNLAREIPLVNRRILELDIEGAIAQGVLKEDRSLEMKVAALNVIRNVFEEGNIFASVDYFEKYAQMNCLEPIVDAIEKVLINCTNTERNSLKAFIIDCIVNQNNGKQLLQMVKKLNIFTQIEIKDLEQQIAEEDLQIPALAALNDWKFNSKCKSRYCKFYLNILILFYFFQKCPALKLVLWKGSLLLAQMPILYVNYWLN